MTQDECLQALMMIGHKATCREIAAAAGLPLINTRYYMKRLHDNGFVKRLDGKGREPYLYEPNGRGL